MRVRVGLERARSIVASRRSEGGFYAASRIAALTQIHPAPADILVFGSRVVDPFSTRWTRKR